jgi:hypothetical protein
MKEGKLKHVQFPFSVFTMNLLDGNFLRAGGYIIF